MAQPHNLQWFEAVCAELARNPMQATAVLTEFREQEFALQAVDGFLRDAACSPLAQFQACLVLQFNSLKNWALLSSAHKLQLRDTLFHVMKGAILSPGVMPAYALNKIMQVFALFWKRDWKDLSTTGPADGGEASIIFQHVAGLIGEGHTFKQGCILLRVLVEEFSNRSSAEAGLPMEFHRRAHTAFEEFGLDQSVHIAMQSLSASFQMTDPLHAVGCIAESVKLLAEIIAWDFGSSNALSNNTGGALSHRNFNNNSRERGIGGGGGGLLLLPRKWRGTVLASGLVDSICDVYTRIRQLLTLHGRQQNVVADCLLCLTELRHLLVSLASVSGQIFDDDGQRRDFGAGIMSRTVPLLDAAVSGPVLDSQIVGNFRAQECENLGTVLLRLLGNCRLIHCCQMPSFEVMLLTLGKATFELSSELAGLAELQLGRIYGAAGAVAGEEEGLLEGWRGDAVTLLLDLWCMVLEDPLMQHGPFEGAGAAESESGRAVVSAQLKHGLRDMAAGVFRQLFESMWRIALCEALAEPEEEEGEDVAAIGVQNTDDLLASICTVGRTHFSAALNHVRESLSLSLDQAEALAAAAPSITASVSATPSASAPSREVLRVLESLRVSVLFAAHLCDDSFRSDPKQKTSELPMVPSFVLDALLLAPETASVLQQTLGQMSRLLQFQMLIGPSHSLFSPRVLHVTLRFCTEYFFRFVDPDPELYSAGLEAGLPLFFSMHGSPHEATSPAREALHGLIGQLAAAVHYILVTVPFEGELVAASAELLGAMAVSPVASSDSPAFANADGSRGRSNIVLAQPTLGEVFRSATAYDCRLNNDGVAAMFGALSRLATLSGSESSMMQLCIYVHTKGASLPSHSDRGPELRVGALQFVACLRGLARCPKGKHEKLLHDLFDASLPIVAWCLAHSALSAEDDVISAVVIMLGDYASCKLSALSQQSSSILYHTALSSLQALSKRLRTASALTQGHAAEEEQSFRSDALLHMLNLLNCLSSKDFVFDDAVDGDVAASADPTGEGGFAFHMTVAQVIMFGFDLIVQLVSPQFLGAFPATAEKYFSFCAFVTSTYGEELGAKLQALNEAEATATLRALVEHLLWGASAVDPCSARLALQSVQSLANFQASSLTRQDPGVGLATAGAVFPAALDRLLEILLFPSTSDYGIGWDRADACAGAVFSLVALDHQRFLHSANAAIESLAQCQPALREPLRQCFHRLTTENGVSLGTNAATGSKANRQAFASNFRAFLVALRPLVVSST